MILPIIEKIKRFKPKNAKEFRKFIPFVKLRKLGYGAYRQAYAVHVEGNPAGAVIKFPCPDSNEITMDHCIEHSSVEYEAYIDLKNKDEYLGLRRYLPEIYYHDEKTGVIVMKQYSRCRSAEGRWYSEFLSNLMEDICPGPYENDVYFNNLGVDEEGNIVLLDLGLVCP